MLFSMVFNGTKTDSGWWFNERASEKEKPRERCVHVGRTKKRMQRVKSRKRQEVGERVWKGRDRGGKREREIE